MAYVKLQPKETVEASSRNVSRRPGGRDHGPSRRVNTNKIIVSPYEDSVVHHILKGHHFEKIWLGGVYLGLDYSINNSNHVFKVKKGYGTIYGRQFELDADYEISMSALTGLKYCVVFVEVNLRAYTAQKATVKLQYAGAGFPEVKSDDLIKKQNGVARLVLYEFIYESTSASPFQDIKTLFYTFEDGTVESVRCLDASAKINGRLVSNLLYHNADRFMKTNRATYADLGKRLGSSTGWLCNGDSMDLSKGTDNRGVLMCVPNAFHITGQTWKSGDNIPTAGYYLNENTNYKFYYRDYKNPIPAGATCVGVWIQGKIRSLHYEGLLGGWKWHANSENQFFHRPYRKHGATIGGAGETPKDTSGRMFPGSVWNKQQVIYIGQAVAQKDLIIGVQMSQYGTTVCLGNEKWEYHSASQGSSELNSTNDYGTIQFLCTETNNPYIEVHISDDKCVACDIYVTLFYIHGSDMRNQASTNQFTKLNPQLEGGQQ